MMSNTPLIDPPASPVPADPPRPTPRLLIDMVMTLLDKQQVSLAQMLKHLKRWDLPDWERGQINDFAEVILRMTQMSHDILDQVVQGWPHLLDDETIRAGIERHTTPLRSAAERIRRDCSVTRVLAIDGMSAAEKHQDELLRAIAFAIDSHCDGLGSILGTPEGSR